MGFPVAVQGSHIFRLHSAFKLLSSKDSIIRELSQLELGLTVREATRRPTDKPDIRTWLNKDQPDTVVARTGNVDTMWTNARRAGARLDEAVQWDLVDCRVVVSFQKPQIKINWSLIKINWFFN